MKLSTAICLGSMATRQAFGQLNDGDGGTCAIGAAMFAVNSPYWQDDWIPQDWTVELFEGRMPIGIRGAIAYKNDLERWPRPQIADWVEQIENQYAQAQELQQTEAVTATV